MQIPNTESNIPQGKYHSINRRMWNSPEAPGSCREVKEILATGMATLSNFIPSVLQTCGINFMPSLNQGPGHSAQQPHLHKARSSVWSLWGRETQKQAMSSLSDKCSGQNGAWAGSWRSRWSWSSKETGLRALRASTYPWNVEEQLWVWDDQS